MSGARSILSSRRFNRSLPWLAGLVLAAGVIAVLLGFFRNTADPIPNTFSNEPAALPQKTPPTVKLAPEVRQLAAKFILSAVVRENLAYAWTISGPQIRAGLTLKEWMTGNIPVVPYPKKAIEIAPFRVDWSYPNSALLEVALLPKKGHDIKPQLFFIELKRIGKGKSRRWVVDSWIPRAAPTLPSTRE